MWNNTEFTDPPQANGQYGRAKLLFADDHHLVLDALLFVASPHYEVRGVDKLAEFEQVLDEYHPDLVVLDVRMADGDGFETAEQVIAQISEREGDVPLHVYRDQICEASRRFRRSGIPFQESANGRDSACNPNRSQWRQICRLANTEPE